MLTSGITSGLVIQNKYLNGWFPSSYSSSDTTTVRPFTDDFDKGVTTVSDPNRIENGRPSVTIPVSVNYKKVFGKGSSADERAYFLERGVDRFQRAAIGQPKGSKVLRNLFRQRMAQPKSSFDLVGVDQLLFSDATDYAMGNVDNIRLPPFFTEYRDRWASIGSLPSQRLSTTSNQSFMETDLTAADINQRDRMASVLDLIDLSGMDTSPRESVADINMQSPSVPDIVMKPVKRSPVKIPIPSLPDVVMAPPAPPPPPTENDIIQSRRIKIPVAPPRPKDLPPPSIGFDNELKKAVEQRAMKRAHSIEEIEEALKKARTDQALKRKFEPPKNFVEEIKAKVAKLE